MKGQYIKNCSCLAHCPCDTVGEPAPNRLCEAVVGMHIQEGNFDSVSLSGLNWAGAAHFPGAVHEGNGTLEAFVDERATEDQRNALLTILTGKAGNPWFEVLAQFITTIHGPHFVRIDWEFDKAKRRARVTIPGFIETESEPLASLDPRGGPDHHVTVRIPAGIEYKETEVARTASLKSMGAVKFDWQKTHSSLADVEHTDQGLVA
ncbi:MAG: DUF1326 domain-containing protein [Chloroflexi bacterium]|nr:DUF1326 domain-containing protein [Chloroflexota bacterium]